VQEHLNQARKKWRKMWKIGGEMARPEDFHVDAWAKLIKYWKSPMAKRESEWMQQIYAMVSNPWKHG
jgi:hypothetical protein